MRIQVLPSLKSVNEVVFCDFRTQFVWMGVSSCYRGWICWMCSKKTSRFFYFGNICKMIFSLFHPWIYEHCFEVDFWFQILHQNYLLFLGFYCTSSDSSSSDSSSFLSIWGSSSFLSIWGFLFHNIWVISVGFIGVALKAFVDGFVECVLLVHEIC